jgi:drug/metabolite transporter (DMT)-like permease
MKGIVAGNIIFSLALTFRATLPSPFQISAAMTVGLGAYAIILTLFVVGLRQLGAARTGAYFSVAPFFGA